MVEQAQSSHQLDNTQEPQHQINRMRPMMLNAKLIISDYRSIIFLLYILAVGIITGTNPSPDNISRLLLSFVAVLLAGLAAIIHSKIKHTNE